MTTDKAVKIRAFPQQEERVETGPIRFGDDWPGVFIRGDHAMHYAHHLTELLNTSPDSLGIAGFFLNGLRLTLLQCVYKFAAPPEHK